MQGFGIDLAAACSANVMFRVSPKVNPLFIRRKIRGAIQEDQPDSVKENIKHDKFKIQCCFRQDYHMAQIHNLPQ